MPDDSFAFLADLDRDAAEAQIVLHHKIIDYDTREYPVEVIVRKYLDGLDEDENDFFVPDYQRELVWPERHQSRFIESVLMGLPIPLLFVADVEGKEGRAEIVDGSQRVRTLARFMSNDLVLGELKILTKLQGFRFRDLPLVRQRRFGRHTLRMIELREGVAEDVRRDIFSRINTGSVKLNDMEQRWGSNDGPFLKFIRTCAQHPLFTKLAPLGKPAIKRHEDQEFVLRFFAYLDRYMDFDRSVVEFLDGYLNENMNLAEGIRLQMSAEWVRMLDFVDKYIHTFSKSKGHVRTPRIRFEALSVGTALALRIKPDLVPVGMIDWLDSTEFKEQMRSDASNSRPKVVKRIEFVRDHLLGA